MADPREEGRPGPEWCEDKLCSGYGGRHAGKHVPFLPPEPRKGLTALAAELCPRAGQPDHLSCRTCARVASWLERHDAALREEWDSVWLDHAGRYFEGIQDRDKLTRQFGDLPPGVIHEIWKRDPRVAALRQAGEQMAEALRYVLERIPSMTWPHVYDVQQKAIDALAAWRSGETQG